MITLIQKIASRLLGFGIGIVTGALSGFVADWHWAKRIDLIPYDEESCCGGQWDGAADDRGSTTIPFVYPILLPFFLVVHAILGAVEGLKKGFLAGLCYPKTLSNYFRNLEDQNYLLAKYKIARPVIFPSMTDIVQFDQDISTLEALYNTKRDALALRCAKGEIISIEALSQSNTQREELDDLKFRLDRAINIKQCYGKYMAIFLGKIKGTEIGEAFITIHINGEYHYEKHTDFLELVAQARSKGQGLTYKGVAIRPSNVRVFTTPVEVQDFFAAQRALAHFVMNQKSDSEQETATLEKDPHHAREKKADVRFLSAPQRDSDLPGATSFAVTC